MSHEQREKKDTALFVVGVILVGSGISVSGARDSIACFGIPNPGIMYLIIGFKDRNKRYIKND